MRYLLDFSLGSRTMLTVRKWLLVGLLFLLMSSSVRAQYNGGMYTSPAYQQALYNQALYNQAMYNQALYRQGGYGGGAALPAYLAGAGRMSSTIAPVDAYGAGGAYGGYPAYTPGSTGYGVTGYGAASYPAAQSYGYSYPPAYDTTGDT